MYSIVSGYMHVVFECKQNVCAVSVSGSLYASSKFLCWVPVIETEAVYVYFSSFCRGIILTFVLVGCTQREKLLDSGVPLFGPWNSSTEQIK